MKIINLEPTCLYGAYVFRCPESNFTTLNKCVNQPRSVARLKDTNVIRMERREECIRASLEKERKKKKRDREEKSERRKKNRDIEERQKGKERERQK